MKIEMKLEAASATAEDRLKNLTPTGRKELTKAMLDWYADRLDKPLAFWALPSDRRLPLAFLGRTLGNLLSTPFEETTPPPASAKRRSVR